MPSSSTTALRRTVVELADLELDDLRAILGGLDDWERNRIGSLLQELDETKGPAPKAQAEAALLQAVPDWLAARLLGDVNAEESRELLDLLPLPRRTTIRAMRANLQITPATVAAVKKLSLMARQGMPDIVSEPRR